MLHLVLVSFVGFLSAPLFAESIDKIFTCKGKFHRSTYDVNVNLAVLQSVYVSDGRAFVEQISVPTARNIRIAPVGYYVEIVNSEEAMTYKTDAFKLVIAHIQNADVLAPGRGKLTIGKGDDLVADVDVICENAR